MNGKILACLLVLCLVAIPAFAIDCDECRDELNAQKCDECREQEKIEPVKCDECRERDELNPVKCDACRERDELEPRKCTACREPEDAVAPFPCKNCPQTLGEPCDECRDEDVLNIRECPDCVDEEKNPTTRRANQRNQNQGNDDSGVSIVFADVQVQENNAGNEQQPESRDRGLFGKLANWFGRVF